MGVEVREIKGETKMSEQTNETNETNETALGPIIKRVSERVQEERTLLARTEAIGIGLIVILLIILIAMLVELARA